MWARGFHALRTKALHPAAISDRFGRVPELELLHTNKREMKTALERIEADKALVGSVVGS